MGLAITGASGVIYGLRLLEELVQRQVVVHLTLSESARHVAKLEMSISMNLQSGHIEGVDDSFYEWVIYHHHSHVGAAPASGSYPLDAVAVVPCSMGTMGRIATGVSHSLVDRMADVALKERRTLILVPRETPYNTIHLQNMLTLSQAGATIMPASPGFYHQPKDTNDLVNFMVGRVLQHLGFDGQCLVKGGWGEISSESTKTHFASERDS